MPTATLTVLLAILSQAGVLSEDAVQNEAATILQQRSEPTSSTTATSQRSQQRRQDINVGRTERQDQSGVRSTGSTEVRRYRGRADGSIEMLDAEGRVLAVYPEGYFMLLMPSAESVRQLESARQVERNHAQESRERIKQGRLDKKLASEEAAQAREDAKGKREEAAAVAAREASAVRLLDRRTGQYVQAIPSTGNAGGSGGAGSEAIRLWDARRHRYVRAVPLESSAE